MLLAGDPGPMRIFGPGPFGKDKMTLLTQLRRNCFRCGRALGWFRIAENIVTGHPERAAKQLVNKAIGRRLVRRVYLK